MPSIEDFAGRAARVVVARPRAALALLLAFCAALAWHAPRLRVDASADTLLTKDNPHYVRASVVDRRFSPGEFLLIAYRPKEGSVYAPRTLEALSAITRELERLERVSAVRSVLDAPLPWLAPDGLGGGFEAGRWTAREQGLSGARLKEALAGAGLYEDLLIDKGQSAAALQVFFEREPGLDRLYDRIARLHERSLEAELSAEQRAELERLQEQAEPLEQELRARRERELRDIRRILAPHAERADLYVGGAHALGFQLIRIVKNDLAVFGAAVGAASCLLLAFLFRRARWVAAPALCAASSILPTMGLFALLGFKTTVISSSFISLQLVLTLALVIHLIVQYRESASAHPGWSQPRLLEDTLARKAAPCFYVWLTASVGFVSLTFSGLQPVISFGWMMIIAMAVSITVSLPLFAAMMALLGREPAPPRGRLVEGLLAAAAGLSRRRPGLVLAASALLLAGFAAGLPRLKVENSFIDYFRERTDVHRELSYIDREFGGTTPLDLLWTVPPAQRKPDLALTAAAVQTAQRVQAALERTRGVGKTLSVVDFTELAMKVNDGKPLTEYELTAAYRTLDAPLREQLTGSLFDERRSQLRFSVRVRDTTPGLDRAELLESVRAELAGLGIPREDYVLTGLFVIYQDILESLFRSQIRTLGVVFAQLGLIFLVLFRSLRVALIALAPNVVTTLAVLGLMGWLGVPLDIMTITIGSIAMGVAVDDTIHYTHRYLEELPGREPGDAVARTHGSIGHAMLYTTVVVMIAFSLLAFSDFMPSVYFGLLTGFAMSVALTADLTLLPVLLCAFVKKP